MNLAEFVDRVAGFLDRSQLDKIRLFGWFLHTHRNKATFSTSDINGCFDEVGVHRPANTSQRLIELARAKDLIQSGGTFKLALSTRREIDAKYAARRETVEVDALLEALPALLSDTQEGDYLVEALTCFRAGAFRAAIVMTWNVVYHHLTCAIVARHLPAFNAFAATRYTGKAAKDQVGGLDDFQRWKESEVIEVSKGANIVSKEVGKVLIEKLDRRNSAAHPSGSKFDKLVTEAYISDVVRNALLKIK